jgi:hypothetical protein
VGTTTTAVVATALTLLVAALVAAGRDVRALPAHHPEPARAPAG